MNFLSAAAIFERGFDRFEGNADYLSAFGYFLYEVGFNDLSKELLVKSVQLDPQGDPRKYFTLGEMHRSEEGLNYYLTGLKLSETKKQGYSSNLSEETKNGNSER